MYRFAAPGRTGEMVLVPPRTAGTPRRSLTRSGATRFLQREREGPGGGQESMARNEAAALATIARMGWETFTVRMLRQATGLSYHQTRRVLQGYTARGTTYCGLLEKCPALGVVDATVLDSSTGTTVRWHELHFPFDAWRSREWVAGLAVWLEDEGGDDPSPDGGCKGGCNPVCNSGYNQGATGVRPLPGVLDHRMFERVKVEPGRCDICDNGRTVIGRGRRRRTSVRCATRGRSGSGTVGREYPGNRGCRLRNKPGVLQDNASAPVLKPR